MCRMTTIAVSQTELRLYVMRAVKKHSVDWINTFTVPLLLTEITKLFWSSQEPALIFPKMVLPNSMKKSPHWLNKDIPFTQF